MHNKSSCSSLWEKGLRASTWNVVGVVSHICNHESDYPFVRDTELDTMQEKDFIFSLKSSVIKFEGS